MSELMNTRQSRNAFRWRLLSTVSSLALVVSVCIERSANAQDDDRPTVWIEVGTDLDRLNDGQTAFSPPFVVNNPTSTAFDPVSPAEAQKQPNFSFGGEGKLSFQPKDSNWSFSAAVRYGRANSNRDIHQTAFNKSVYNYAFYSGPFGRFAPNPPQHVVPQTANFFHAQEKQSESNVVLDFEAGRDFGLGLLGREGTSVLNAGVRFAQFSFRMQSNLQARPDLDFYARHYPNSYPYKSHVHGTFYVNHYHQYVATAHSSRSFRGVGPSLSWNSSAPFAGNPENGELSIDWGANAALLFGRQKANVQHQTSATYVAAKYHGSQGTHYNRPQVNLQRARTIAVPNVGGFAGMTFSFTNFKASFGYRGDFFFGAMDTGFDTAKHSTMGFYGPFATVSIGLGG